MAFGGCSIVESAGQAQNGAEKKEVTAKSQKTEP